MRRCNIGDIVYFISNGYKIRKATVVRASNGFCTIKFLDKQSPMGTKVRETKLYPTEEEAKANIK